MTVDRVPIFPEKSEPEEAKAKNTRKSLHDTPLSMLDLVSVREEGTVAEALAISLRTAQRAEAIGFKRFWLAGTPQHAGYREFSHCCPRRTHCRQHAANPRGLTDFNWHQG